jgi:hypothetical protein
MTTWDPIQIPSVLSKDRPLIIYRFTPQAFLDSYDQAHTQINVGTLNRIKGHPIDIINTNSTLESTLRQDNLAPNTQPPNG